jgi:hypothetical protein
LLKAYKREKKKQLYHGYGVTKYTGNWSSISEFQGLDETIYMKQSTVSNMYIFSVMLTCWHMEDCKGFQVAVSHHSLFLCFSVQRLPWTNYLYCLLPVILWMKFFEGWVGLYNLQVHDIRVNCAYLRVRGGRVVLDLTCLMCLTYRPVTNVCGGRALNKLHRIQGIFKTWIMYLWFPQGTSVSFTIHSPNVLGKRDSVAAVLSPGRVAQISQGNLWWKMLQKYNNKKYKYTKYKY